MPKRLGVGQVSEGIGKEKENTHAMLTISPTKEAPRVFRMSTTAEATMPLEGRWMVQKKERLNGATDLIEASALTLMNLTEPEA